MGVAVLETLVLFTKEDAESIREKVLETKLILVPFDILFVSGRSYVGLVGVIGKWSGPSSGEALMR